MKINNQTGITYSMIERNTNNRKQTQQNESVDTVIKKADEKLYEEKAKRKYPRKGV